MACRGVHNRRTQIGASDDHASRGRFVAPLDLTRQVVDFQRFSFVRAEHHGNVR
jgi:hypothetical protein